MGITGLKEMLSGGEKAIFSVLVIHRKQDAVVAPAPIGGIRTRNEDAPVARKQSGHTGNFIGGTGASCRASGEPVLTEIVARPASSVNGRRRRSDAGQRHGDGNGMAGPVPAAASGRPFPSAVRNRLPLVQFLLNYF